MGAAEQARLKPVMPGSDQMSFKASLSFWSFGERVTVEVGSVAGNSVIDVSSSCILPTQIVDWGKNERNVLGLFNKIDKVLGDECEHEVCLLCVRCSYLLVGISSATCPECGYVHSAHDKTRTQEVATVRNGIAMAVTITFIELVILLLLDVSGANAYVPSMLQGVRGVVLLVSLNFAVILGNVGLNYLMKRFRWRRRTAGAASKNENKPG